MKHRRLTMFPTTGAPQDAAAIWDIRHLDLDAPATLVVFECGFCWRCREISLLASGRLSVDRGEPHGWWFRMGRDVTGRRTLHMNWNWQNDEEAAKHHACRELLPWSSIYFLNTADPQYNLLLVERPTSIQSW